MHEHKPQVICDTEACGVCFGIALEASPLERVRKLEPLPIIVPKSTFKMTAEDLTAWKDALYNAGH